MAFSSIIADLQRQIAEAKRNIKIAEENIATNRDLRIGTVSDSYDRYSRIIDENKALKEKYNASIKSLEQQIAAENKRIAERNASERQKLQTEFTSQKLGKINEAQMLQDRAKQDFNAPQAQPEKQTTFTYSAQSAAPAVEMKEKQAATVGVASAPFTKFSGLGAAQMRQQMAAPPQNATGTTQNAFTLPNAQGLKFGGA